VTDALDLTPIESLAHARARIETMPSPALMPKLAVARSRGLD